MKSFGKGLFWFGFILLMGVVVAYLIMMVAGTLAFATWVTTLTICGVIFVGGILMLIGRGYERRSEAKRFERREAADLQNAARTPQPLPEEKNN